MDFLEDLKNAKNKSATVIKHGGVVIFPTDTVYGFLADADNKKAVEKIYKIKKRPRKKPLPVFIKDLKMAKTLAEISKNQGKIIKKYWPGRYTFVLKAKIKNPKLVKNGAIALRVPKYKPLNDLLKKINKPLAQTSANISGQPSLNKITDIIKIFKNKKNKPDLIVSNGNLPKRKASCIIDLTQDKIKYIRK